MSEKLTIRNFGPIKDVTLDLKRVNILIGDQGTGKSTIGKLLAIFNDEWFIQESKFLDFLERYNIDSYLNDSTEIAYSNEFIKITFKKEINIHFLDEKLLRLVENIRLTREKWRSTNDEILLNELVKIRAEFQKEYYVSKYIPSERTLIGANDEISSSPEGSDKSLAYLSDFEDNFKKAKKVESFNVLDYSFIGKDNIWFLKRPGKNIRLKVVSSGIQSVFPLALSYAYNSVTIDKLFHVIEEPEQNLYPASQYKLIKYLISTSKMNDHKILITTHSPYILTSLNNLMYAYEIGQDHEKETNAVIDKKYWINPNNVSAYMLLTDGTCEDIVDREENLIKAEKIDGVTNILNEQFDALLNIELVQK